MPFQSTLGSYTKLNGYSSICWHTWHHCIDFFKIISKDAFHTPIISLSSETLYRAFKVEYLLCGYCIFIFWLPWPKPDKKLIRRGVCFGWRPSCQGKSWRLGPKGWRETTADSLFPPLPSVQDPNPCMVSLTVRVGVPTKPFWKCTTDIGGMSPGWF